MSSIAEQSPSGLRFKEEIEPVLEAGKKVYNATENCIVKIWINDGATYGDVVINDVAIATLYANGFINISKSSPKLLGEVTYDNQYHNDHTIIALVLLLERGDKLSFAQQNTAIKLQIYNI